MTAFVHILSIFVLIAVVNGKPSLLWPGHIVPAGPTTLIGASGIVGPHGATGPSGSVSGHGAVGPSGEHNAIGHSYDDGQWHGEGLLESQDYSGHGLAIGAPAIITTHGALGGHGLGWVSGHSAHW